MQEKKERRKEGERSMGARWRDTLVAPRCNNERLKGKDYSINSINFNLSSRLISERVRATMSRVPDEAVAQAASVPFVPSGGDQAGIVLQR